MTRSVTRSIAPAGVAALALPAGGCACDGSTDASTNASPGGSATASVSAAP